MIARLTILALLLWSIILSAPATARASVTDEVKRTVDEVVRIVSDKELKKPQNEKKRRQELKAAVGRIFNYGERSLSASLKSSWRIPTRARSSRTTRKRSFTFPRTWKESTPR